MSDTDPRPCGGDAHHSHVPDKRKYRTCRTCTNNAAYPVHRGKCPGPDMRLLALAASEVAAERGQYILSIRRGIGSYTR